MTINISLKDYNGPLKQRHRQKNILLSIPEKMSFFFFFFWSVITMDNLLDELLAPLDLNGKSNNGSPGNVLQKAVKVIGLMKFNLKVKTHLAL